jgi:site-specific DNA recombinase
MTMGQAAIYARVSGEEQKEQGTIETQRDFARRYADLHQLGPLLEFSDEGYSGTIPLEERPAGNRLLAATQAGLVTTCYVYKLDRLGRNPRVILNGIAALEERGARVISMTEPFDTRDASGRFLVTVLSGVAGLERDNIAERTSGGVRRAAKEGRWVGGIVPFGYQVTGEGAERRLAPQETPHAGHSLPPAAIVQQLYQWVGEEGWSATRAAHELERLGVPPRYPAGTRLTVNGNLNEGKWTETVVVRILRSTTYRGVHQFGKRSKRGMIERECPALVSLELWEAAQLAMDRKRRYNGPRPQPYLLSGILTCGHCEKAFTGYSTKAIYGKQLAVPYHYYRCGGKGFRQGEERCRSRLLLMREADERVWEEVTGLLRDPEKAIRAATLARQQAGAGNQEEERRQAELRLGELKVQRERISRQHQRGQIDDETADTRFGEVKEEEAEWRERLLVLSNAPALNAWQGDARLLLARVQQQLMGEADGAARREACSALIRRAQVTFTEGREYDLHLDWSFTPQIFSAAG